MFDRLAALAKAGPEQDLNANEEARALLALVSREDDRQVLRLAVLHDLDGTALGKALGISSGAARVRLHRAINRLRDAYHHRVTSNRGEADG
jgi:DNA-directed RNA polymerase specialized sigma24 family protein